MASHFNLIPEERILGKIMILRNERVILDAHLAELYGVETRVLKQAVKRNLHRFPADFMFELDEAAMDSVVSQAVIPHRKSFGGSAPFAFTVPGVAMLSSVLKSSKAVEMNIAISNLQGYTINSGGSIQLGAETGSVITLGAAYENIYIGASNGTVRFSDGDLVTDATGTYLPAGTTTTVTLEGNSSLNLLGGVFNLSASTNLSLQGLSSTDLVVGLPPSAVRSARLLRLKHYELSNHLGNVLALVSDLKLGIDVNADYIAEAYAPDVMAYTDYYPFGSPMPGRVFNAGDYRHGFNGKEKDNEVKGIGNSVDFGARIYDPRLGRWLSTDPAQQEYPFASPYSFVLNTPIQAVDPDGKRVYFVAGAGNDPGGEWKYPQRFKQIWEKKGIEDFQIMDMSHGKIGDMMFTDTWRRDNVVGGPRSTGVIKAIDNEMVQATVNQIVADLTENPLGEGEQLNLAGYSYGSVLQAQVALALVDKGVQVDNLVLIGSPIADDSPLYRKLMEAQQAGTIGNVSRQDIPNDLLSNPSSELEYLFGAFQNLPEDGPHFDLARPGEEADKKIGESAEQAKKDGVR